MFFHNIFLKIIFIYFKKVVESWTRKKKKPPLGSSFIVGSQALLKIVYTILFRTFSMPILATLQTYTNNRNNRLGFILQLKYYIYHESFPSSISEIESIPTQYICDQLEKPLTSIHMLQLILLRKLKVHLIH